MLTISNVHNSQLNNHSKVNFTSDNKSSGSSGNPKALNMALLGLAMLGMASCSNDDFDYESYNKPNVETVDTQKNDSLNKNHSIDSYMRDLGFLEGENKLGDVDNIYFEDMHGTKHYMEKGDSVDYYGTPSGIQFHGFDIDREGNKKEYNIKFEKYHGGLIVTKDTINPTYKEGGVDTLKYTHSNGHVSNTIRPSQPRDTVTYRFHANDNGTYTVQKASGKGIIFYVPVANARKTSGGLLFEGYDWVKEQRTDDIEVLNNFRNNVAIPKDEE